MFSTFWAHQAAPTVWNSAFMTPIPKKGHDLAEVGNWRGIALQCHLKKMYELSVREVMRKKGWLEHHVLQTGFQAKTGALDSVFVVDELTSYYDRIGRPLSAVLLDIRKAYDRTARALIWRKLRTRGCPNHIIGVLQSLLDRGKIVIRLDGVCSEAVETQVGVPQGDVLSPSMFNILVDELPDRLIKACAPFGGCPRYGGIVMPVIMYADDQTIFHFDPRAMQAMLNAAAAYAEDHFFEYNVNKSAVSMAISHKWRPLIVEGQAVPVVESIPLLGVQLRAGLIDHRLQLATRLVQAEKATFGLEQVGALATPFLSLTRKSQLLSAFCRSRYEYGFAISRHQQAGLDRVDRFISRQAARCIGSGRGSQTALRLSGLVPAKIRQAQLHFKMATRMKEATQGNGAKLLTVRIYEKALQDQHSNISKWWRSCKIQKLAGEKMATYRRQYAQAAADPARELDPGPGVDQAKRMWRRAIDCAIREKSWEKQERSSKLMRLQTQEWNKPHSIAYMAGSEALELQRWMCNLTPGAQYPCKNCNGEFKVSRYHILRCGQAAALLGDQYDAEMDLRQRPRADNVIDTQIPEMIPRPIRKDAIQAEIDKCPLPRLQGEHAGQRQWRTRVAQTLPVFKDDALKAKIRKMGNVLKDIRRLCCEPRPEREAIADVDDDPDEADDDAEHIHHQEDERATQDRQGGLPEPQPDDVQRPASPIPIGDDQRRHHQRRRQRGGAGDSQARTAEFSAQSRPSQPPCTSMVVSLSSSAAIAIGSRSPGHRPSVAGGVPDSRPSLGAGNSTSSKRSLTSSIGSGQGDLSKSKRGRVQQPKNTLRTRTSSQARLTSRIGPRKRSRAAGDAPGRVHVQTSIMAFCVRSQDIVGSGGIGGGPAGSPVLPPDR
jgi:hypothetical protein